MSKDINLYYDKTYNFREIFDRKTGFYIRTGILEEGPERDPFMRSFPALLDIGIMGGCKAASLGLCRAGGHVSGCYQGARKHNPEKDMKFEDYKRIIDEGAKKGLQQVALGGAGNPNDHKDFVEILKYTRSRGIVPNYTTAGIELTDEMVQATKECCGAVAVSWYGQQYTIDALNKFIEAGCKTSIHFVLSKETIQSAINLLKNHILEYTDQENRARIFDFNDNKINAIIFLLYKPVGLGRKENVLTIEEDNNKIKEFFSLVGSKEHPFKIGFDSCSIPAVLQFSDNINEQSVDTCEGARFSAYINSDMVMVPCSFDQTLKWGVSLKDKTVEDVWNSKKFAAFRSHLFMSCPGCKNRENCMGGCPIKNEIVLCNSQNRKEIGVEFAA